MTLHDARFDPIRLREQAILERLLALLRQRDSAHLDQVRDALFHTDHPFLVVLVGPFNAGKSTLINALIGAPVLPIGPTPTTMRITILRHGEETEDIRTDGNVYTRFHAAPILETVSFVDTPGLESVFTQHDTMTRRFLHRADVVMLVLLATQALGAGSLDDLAALHDYGKPVLILANQADLLAPDEREDVRRFITETCKRQLGEVPPVWLVSAKEGLEAALADDEAAWQASGMERVRAHLQEQMGDDERMRQKLQTPVQIGQHAARAALAQVNAELASLDAHRSAVANLHAQIDSTLAEQQENAAAYHEQIDRAFEEAADRGARAIGQMFRFGAALGLLRRGLVELFGLSRFMRTSPSERYASRTFEAHAVNKPLEDLRKETAKLGPRLEGEDIKDLERLADYGREQVKKLPDALREKVIGSVEAPLSYRRAHFNEAGAALGNIIKEATTVEDAPMERAVRSAVIALAGWEVTIFAVVALLNLLGMAGTENGPVILLVVFILVILGFAWMPLQAIRLARQHTARLDRLRQGFIESLDAAVHEHLDYARQAREGAVQPYTRLVETQAAQLEALRAELMQIQDDLVETEKMLQAV